MTDAPPPNPPATPAAAAAAPAAPQATLTFGLEEIGTLIDLKEAQLDRAKGHLAQATLEVQLAEADLATLKTMHQASTPFKVTAS